MKLAAAFFGIALTCWGSAAGCLIVVFFVGSELAQFYAAWGSALFAGVALGCTIASVFGYQEAIMVEKLRSR